MNLEETAAVLAYFAAAWPNQNLPEETVQVWATELVDVDPANASDAMHRLVRECEWMPTVARFRAACVTVALERRNRVAEAAGLPSGRPAEWPAELVAELREMLKTAPAAEKRA